MHENILFTGDYQKNVKIKAKRVSEDLPPPSLSPCVYIQKLMFPIRGKFLPCFALNKIVIFIWFGRLVALCRVLFIPHSTCLCMYICLGYGSHLHSHLFHSHTNECASDWMGRARILRPAPDSKANGNSIITSYSHRRREEAAAEVAAAHFSAWM